MPLKRNLIRPKPKQSFNKFQILCPWHIKARCGRCYCNHEANAGRGVTGTKRCTKLTCPFYGEVEQLMKKNNKTSYRVPKRYRGAIV